MSLCKFIHRNLLFVTYCIQKCQKCCKIVRDRVPSLKRSAGTAFPRVPAPQHHCLQVDPGRNARSKERDAETDTRTEDRGSIIPITSDASLKFEKSQDRAPEKAKKCQVHHFGCALFYSYLSKKKSGLFLP